jgi:hypothetical protein
MLKRSLTVIAVLANLSLLAFGQAPVTLVQDTAIRIRIVDSFAVRDAQVGQQINFEVADAVWNGSYIAIPQRALVIGNIVRIHKNFRGRADQIWFRLRYIRTSSGERIPLHIFLPGEADWKIDLVKGVVNAGLEIKAYVSRETQLWVVQSTTLDHPGATDPVSLRSIVSR